MSKLRIKQILEFGDVSGAETGDILSFNSEGFLVPDAPPVGLPGSDGNTIRVRFDSSYTASNFNGAFGTFANDDSFALYEGDFNNGNTRDKLVTSTNDITHLVLNDSHPLLNYFKSILTNLDDNIYAGALFFTKISGNGPTEFSLDLDNAAVTLISDETSFPINLTSETSSGGQTGTQFEDEAVYDIKVAAVGAQGAQGAQGQTGAQGAQGSDGAVPGCNGYTINSAQDGVPNADGEMAFQDGQSLTDDITNLGNGDFILFHKNNADGDPVGMLNAPFGGQLKLLRADGVGTAAVFDISVSTLVSNQYYKLEIAGVTNAGIPDTDTSTGMCFTEFFANSGLVTGDDGSSFGFTSYSAAAAGPQGTVSEAPYFVSASSTNTASSPTNGEIRTSTLINNLSVDDQITVMIPTTDSRSSTKKTSTIDQLDGATNATAKSIIDLVGIDFSVKLYITGLSSSGTGFKTFNATVKSIDGTVGDNKNVKIVENYSGIDGAQGAQGNQGAQGPQGNQGPQGQVGDTGPQGVQGPQGQVGDTGPRGVQGPQGAVGDTGPQGVQGPQGAVGDTGPQGVQGPQGQVGDTGPQGVQGPQGAVGDTGPQGVQGPQGAVGDTGPQGVQGPQGAQGNTGPQGVQGPQGAVGDTGPQGVQGPQGAVGDTGPQGVQGPQGAQGNTGPQGNQGPQGQVGDTGPQGVQGPQGAQGPQGSGFDTVANPADDRILTSDGTVTGANAESNLTWDGQTLTVTGSQADATVLDIQGVNGQLFSVVDSLTDDLFTVKDGSGTTIFNVDADDQVEVFGTLKIETTSDTGLTSNTTIIDIPQADGNAAWIDYYASNGTALRSGTVMVVWDGTNIEFTEIGTKDLGGSTDGLGFTATDQGTVIRLTAAITSGTWSVKTGVRIV